MVLGHHGKAHDGGDHISERPHFAAGTTQRDIHVAEVGQSEAPEGANELTRIAVWRPLPGKTTVKPEAALNERELGVLRELKEYTESNLVLRPEDEDYEDYAEWERRFLDRPDTYPRYVRASGGKLEDAIRRIRDTLQWRREYRPDLIKPKDIAIEAEGGKVVVNGFDIHGRPIVWLRPSRENTKPSPLQIRHLIFQLERAIDLMPPGISKMALVVDYHGATASSNPSVDTAKQVIHILQNHYCERLGKAVVMNVPWYLNAFFNMLKPLLDPHTKEKIKFNPHMDEMVPPQQLDHEFGGEHNYVYDSKVYLPALCHFCGIKSDGTREEWIPKDHPESEHARPEQIQRQHTYMRDHEQLAEEARQEAESGKAGSLAATGKSPNAPLTAASSPLPSTTSPAAKGPISGGSPITRQATLPSTAKTGGTVVVMPSGNPQSQLGTVQNGSAATMATASAPIAAAAAAAIAAGEGSTSPANANGHSSDNAAVTHDNEAVPTPTRAVTGSSHATSTTASTSLGRSTSSVSSSRKRGGGAKIFASGRGLDADGNPKVHKHKHLSKIFCMHKGAVHPRDADNLRASTKSTGLAAALPNAENGATEKGVTADREWTTDEIPAQPGRGRVRIADDAAMSKPYNPPLATNATWGTDAYQTALEEPEQGDMDYFSDARHRAVPVNNHADAAQVVTRPTDLMHRLETENPEELTMAFSVLKPPGGGAGNGMAAETNGNGLASVQEDSKGAPLTMEYKVLKAPAGEASEKPAGLAAA